MHPPATARAKAPRNTKKSGDRSRPAPGRVRAPIKPSQPPFPVVGVGASAGGLDAFLQLFKALPAATGMGFVVIQHMDPSKESLLSGILGRAIATPIIEAKDGMPVKPDRIHVIPPNTNMGIAEGRLTLVPRTETRGLHLPVDFFFRSLARDRKDRAIGVVLSGNGSDGTQGMRAIKSEGGITFAQDSESAKYPGMPESAVESGSVDFVLPPDGIASELARIGTHPYVVQKAELPARDMAMEPDEDAARIFLLVRDVTGVDFSQYKPSTTKRRILRRLALHKIPDFKAYAGRLHEDPRELEALYQDLLINVTSFFRDPEMFETLREKVIPKLLDDRAPADPIRVWVPGCSTGEEAYSIALLLAEAMKNRGVAFPMQIFATDINDNALENARLGIYPEGIAQDVSPERLRSYFAKSGRGYQINKATRESCIFARQNLAKDPPFSRLDLVSCRNVLIYMKTALHRKILATFHYALKPSGFLVLGNSETVGDMADLFAAIDRKSRIYSRKAVLARPTVDFALPRHAPDAAMARRRAGDVAPSLEELQKEADRVVLARYGPAGVVVNEQLDIIQFRGRTAQFIAPAPGTASLNLAKLAREGLIHDLRMTVRKARAERGPVRKEGTRIAVNAGHMDLDIQVIPIKLAGLKEDYYLVLFEEAPHADDASGPRDSRRREKLSKEREQYITQVENELATTKEYLQTISEEYEATNEELRSANEEIQSSNEELQSTNEELETAKEELQSTNEELITVNETLTNRNAELALLNDDLSNLLASVNIPLVMVGNDLRIRRFTPNAEKLLCLIASDVGRPIVDINPALPLRDLGSKIREVLETLAVKEEEITGVDDRVHLVRIRPYRTEDNKIDGAVVTLFDITAVKSSQRVEDAVRVFRGIVAAARGALIALDADHRVLFASPMFHRAFRTAPEEMENRLFFELGGGRWDVPGLRALLRDLADGIAAPDDRTVTIDFPDGGPKTVVVSARPIQGYSLKPDMILLTFEAGMTGQSAADPG